MSEDFAPFGRLIQCELIVTVDSSSINTPVIGLVTENVYHHGHLIIPAGTEVHGSAQVDRVRERIASDGRWTLVWQTGEELRVSGLALDREKDADDDGWGITDGSAGLRGRLIKRDDLAEIKIFAATLLSGAAEAFTEKRATAFGSFAVPSLTNAPLQGAQSVLDRYAKQIQQTIERDGFYVRVPAGKQFYLYVTQTMDRADAKDRRRSRRKDRRAERPGNLRSGLGRAVPRLSDLAVTSHLKTHSTKSMKRLLLLYPSSFSLPVRTGHQRKSSLFLPSRPASRDEATVRKPEEVRQYRFGRYVDPGNRQVMHEAHPVYRIERTAGWNLRPDGTSQATRATASPSSRSDFTRRLRRRRDQQAEGGNQGIH